MVFIQRNNWISRREYLIEKDGVWMITRSFIRVTKKFFDFHHIGNEIRKTKQSSKIIISFCALLFISGGFLLYQTHETGQHFSRGIGLLSLSLLILLTYYILRPSYLNLESKRYKTVIPFLNNRPSEESLKTFISQIHKAQRISLQRRYLTIDERMAYEEYRKNIQWLKDRDFISDNEAKQRLGDIDQSFE